ncbi:MAG: hypothetical protein ACXW2C_10180, partial [Acidimicrobiia bacterium]
DHIDFPAKQKLLQQLKTRRYEAAMNTCSNAIMTILRTTRRTGNLAELNHGLYPKLTLLELMIDQLRNHGPRPYAGIQTLPTSEAETSDMIRELRREARVRM